MNQNRHRYDIYFDIIMSLIDHNLDKEKLRARIRGTSIDYFSKHLQETVSFGLVEENSNLYRVTEKGRQFAGDYYVFHKKYGIEMHVKTPREKIEIYFE